MGLIKRGKNLLSTHAKKVLYFSQVHSLITYGMSILGTSVSKSNLKHIQTIQNNCLRCIEPKMCLTDIHKKHKILRVEDLIKLEQYKMGYKACSNLLPVRLLTCLFTDSKDRTLRKTHGYNTRRKEIPNREILPGGFGMKHKQEDKMVSPAQNNIANGLYQTISNAKFTQILCLLNPEFTLTINHFKRIKDIAHNSY